MTRKEFLATIAGVFTGLSLPLPEGEDAEEEGAELDLRTSDDIAGVDHKEGFSAITGEYGFLSLDFIDENRIMKLECLPNKALGKALIETFEDGSTISVLDKSYRVSHINYYAFDDAMPTMTATLEIEE